MTSLPPARREAGTARKALLEAATAMFLATGYDAASLEQIADGAGIARRTIYNQFASKEALFRTVIEELEPSFSLPPENDACSDDPRGVLALVAHDAINALDKLTTVAFIRMTIAQNSALQKAVRELYGRSHARIIDGIVRYLRRLQQHDIVRVKDFNHAAHQFVGLVSEAVIWSRGLGDRHRATRPHTESTVNEAVNIFLSVYSEARIFPEGKSVSRLKNRS